MAKAYENGKTETLRFALWCAIRDRESMINSLRESFYNCDQMSREQILEGLSKSDREYYLETESWIRDFRKLYATTRGK